MAEQFTVNGITRQTTMDRLAYEKYQQQLKDRRDLGRYTLEEAALALSEEVGERADQILKKIMNAVRNGVLPVYEPGKKARYLYGDGFATCVRDFHEEAYWSDLNEWLKKDELRLDWEFPNPDMMPAAKGNAVRGINKHQVINAFAGMHFNRDQWGKYLASPPNWLKGCRVERGSKSISATWNPCFIAIALADRGVAMKALDAVFVRLNEWADEWRKVSELLR
ncbi:MAG: hypothetical protein ACYDC8_08685 [Gammaproteobacteria bacterium]